MTHGDASGSERDREEHISRKRGATAAKIPRNNVPVSRRDLIVTFPVVALFYVGDLKAIPPVGALPVDLTLVTMAALLCVTALELRRWKSLPAGLLPLFVVLAVFVCALFHQPLSQYESAKTFLLFALTLPAAVMAAIIVRTKSRLLCVGWMTVGWGILVALIAVGVPSPQDLSGRLALGDNTIATGRAFGAAAIVILAFGVAGVWKWRWAAPLVMLFVFLIFESGSRAPLVALAASAAFIATRQAPLRQVRLGLALVVALLASVPLLVTRVDATTLNRYLLLFASNKGASVNVRDELYSQSFQLGLAHPYGVGWGGFSRYFPALQYPHDIFLEVFAEAGWISLFAFSALCVISLGRMWRYAATPFGAAATALIAYSTVNALFSGDINDNRAALILIAIGLVTFAGSSSARVAHSVSTPSSNV